MQVIQSPKKYKEDMDRINKADLGYPIIVHKNDIVDGMHRLLKTISQNKKVIDAYVFDDTLMKKFNLGKRTSKTLDEQFESFKLIERFHKEFCS
jgi:hypothetical protein